MPNVSLLHQACLLSIAALAVACRPLDGVNPLDSGEFATEAMEVTSARPELLDERRMQDERLWRSDGGGSDADEFRGSAGIDVMSEF